MKRTTKRLFALLLTVVMTLPLLTLGATATEGATTETALSSNAFLDFSNADEAAPYLGGRVENKSPTLKVEDGVLKFIPDQRDARYLLTFNNIENTKYFSVRFDFQLSADVTDSGYFGFVFRPHASTKDTDQRNAYSYADKFNFSNGSYAKLSAKTWYNYEFVRDASTIHTFLRDADGNVLAYKDEKLSDAGLALTSTPCVRLMCGTDPSIVFSIDNLSLKDTTPNPNAMVEDFEGMVSETMATPTTSTTTARPLGALSTYSMSTNFVSTIVEENGNKYLKVTSSIGANNYWFYPNGFDATTNYTISLDFKYTGTPEANNTSEYIGVAYGSVLGTAGRYISYYNPRGLKVNGDNTTYADYVHGEWYSAKIVRNGNKIDYYVWKKGDPNATIMYGGTGGEVTTAGVPCFRIMMSNTENGEICLDNISIKSFDGSINFVGAQKSTTVAADNTYAVRFIGTVDSLDYTTVGFKIKATYTENGQTVTRIFDKTDCKVYTSITASANDNIESYTAEELGGNYLIALSIYGIPVSAGDVTFEIVTVSDIPGILTSKAQTKQYTSTAKTLYADVTDNTVELKNSLG